MTDQLDRAQKFENDFFTQAIKQQQQRVQEKPDEDEHGRYCLDCADVISLERIKAQPNAVRCVSCQQLKE